MRTKKHQGGVRDMTIEKPNTVRELAFLLALSARFAAREEMSRGAKFPNDGYRRSR